MAEKDFYTILQVTPAASSEEIKEAYKRLALRFHPDLSKDPNANRMMQSVNEAYDILKDPVKRAEYDRYLLSLTVFVPVIPPAPPAPVARPIVSIPRRRRKASHRKIDPARVQAEVQIHLTWLARIVVAIIVLFFFSLIIEQMLWPVFLLLIGLCIYLVVSLMVKIRS